VTFKVEDRQIYAHKAILSAQCEHFRAMFTNGMKESNQQEIEVTEWSHNSYLMMIEYLYTGSIVNFNQKIAIELLGISDAYMLEGLKYLCENTLMLNVTIDNVCALLIDANKFQASELKKFCQIFLMKSFQEVSQTKGFEELEYFPSLLMEVTRLAFSKDVTPDMGQFQQP